MKFRFRKSSRVSKRIRRIEKEISALGADISGLSRELSRGGGVAGRGSGYRRQTGESHPDYRRSPQKETVGWAAQSRGAPSGGQPGRPPVPDSAGTPDSPAGFASRDDDLLAEYFMRTGLSREVPLRQERNVQRNKTIFLLVVLLLILFGLVYFYCA